MRHNHMYFTYRRYLSLVSVLTILHYVVLSNLRESTIIDPTPVYVLNLDRSKDRLSETSLIFAAESVSFKRFSASDGYELTFLDMNKQITMNADMLKQARRGGATGNYKVIDDRYEEAAFIFTDSAKTEKLLLGEIGCAYSHRAIWLDILKHGYDRAVVFEDDVIPMSNFKKNLHCILARIPKDADFVMLDYKCYEGPRDVGHRGRIYQIFKYNCIGKAEGSNALYGTYAYIVTKKGARKLLKLTDKLDGPIDTAINASAISGAISRFVTRYRVVRTVAGTSVIRRAVHKK